jgi:hypothetical protein
LISHLLIICGRLPLFAGSKQRVYLQCRQFQQGGRCQVFPQPYTSH